MTVVGDTRVLPETLDGDRRAAAADVRAAQLYAADVARRRERDSRPDRPGRPTWILDLTPPSSRPSSTRCGASPTTKWRRAPPPSTSRTPSRAIWCARAGALGLMGVTIPEAWGGRGLDDVAYALAIEVVVAASATVGGDPGGQQLARRRAARCARHRRAEDALAAPARARRRVGAFALSEEHAGTDAANQHTRVPHDGGFRLVGQKVWVANAGRGPR